MAVTRPNHGPAGRWAAALVLGLLMAGGRVAAEEWHEAYRSGLTALARGDATRAAEALRRAVALRPEPGRNVVTYGTNVEPRYFPYLHLAEACLTLGQLEAAGEALETSARWGREPADERQKLLARLAAARDQRRPAPQEPTPAPAPVTTIAAPPPAAPITVAPETPAPAIPPVPVPHPPTPTPAALPLPESPAPRAPRPRAEPSTSEAVPVTPASETAMGTLEIVSQPAGAAVYVDDEPVGSTDPETGRLVKTGLSAGRHRVRLSRADHEDAVRDIDLSRGGNASFYATLKPAGAAATGLRPEFVAFAVVAIAFIAVIAWFARRRPSEAPSSIWVPTPRSGRATFPSAVTPQGPVTPGVRRDELGQEWFGDFRLLELLGRGGMASVYKVERRHELSALKRPLGGFLEDPEFLERFRREAEIGRTLNHPNIVRILERGDVEGVPYFTMELIPGETLQGLVRSRGAIEPRRAASIVTQVAEALDFAHSKGVIHRDLKPSNIMLLEDGAAKVMDFGIARARRFEGLTVTGAFLGTPEYVAPETIEGQGSEMRSDLYSVGVIFYELLTGQRPFMGDTPFAVLKMHCSEEPLPPSRVKEGVPHGLEAIVLRLLRKDPAERPASAEELVVALHDWLNRAA
jgi:hypothetical protein